jgi:ATP synthase protein I
VNYQKELMSKAEEDVKRIRKAEAEKRTLMAQTLFLGTVGISIALPIVAGAYLGSWLDSKLTGFSVSWTISLILSGVFIGALNVYLLIRRSE